MPLLPLKVRIAVLAILTVIGIASTAYWIQENGSCTVQRRTTVQETDESVVTNQTISGGFAPAICSMESTQGMLLGVAGPMLTAAGIWFGLKTLF